MKSSIIIMLPSQSQVYSETIEVVINKIVKYFGNKFAKVDDEYPIVVVTCEVTQDDIDIIREGLHNSISLMVIVGNDNSPSIDGNFIRLE